MSELQAEIEAYLLAAGSWVPAGDIVARFDLRDARVLRASGGRSGLLDAFAFSHTTHGIIHHRNLSQTDFLRLSNTIGRHGIAQLRKRKAQRLARRHCLAMLPNGIQLEAHTGQMKLL